MKRNGPWRQHRLRMAIVMRDLGPDVINGLIITEFRSRHPDCSYADSGLIRLVQNLRQSTGLSWWMIYQSDLDQLVATLEAEHGQRLESR